MAATTTTVSPETTSLISPLKKPAILNRLSGDHTPKKNNLNSTAVPTGVANP